jgi:3D (Asp-Asp-Asp) domain-containing protein
MLSGSVEAPAASAVQAADPPALRDMAVTLVIDGVSQTVRTAATNVGELLTTEGVAFDRHDRLVPAASAPLASDETIRLTHLNAWTETVRKPIPAPVKKIGSFEVEAGKTMVVAAGAPGLRELTYLVTRTDRSSRPRRSLLAARILRPSRLRVIATGLDDYAALAEVARRGFDGTIKLAGAALSMIATAYTASCAGCSGYTAIGPRAGHGIVAVDPRVIPLGTRLFIPGYGSAVAGDTGGAIRGNRIDLGFNSNSDATRFGRRTVVVYVLPKHLR